jgi:uncharacterized damage-inducible protein DinB
MVALLQKQYELIKGSRDVVFNVLEANGDELINIPVAAFEGKTICWLLVHIANTYVHWLSNFAVKQDMPYAAGTTLRCISDIRLLYNTIDKEVAIFLADFSDNLEEPIHGTISRNRQVSASPLQLFTHVITHEFHHKGQVMTMFRLLGYTPPDTDVIRS